VKSSSRQGQSVVLRPTIRKEPEKRPLHPIIIIVARALTAGVIIGLVLAHSAAQDAMLRRLVQTRSTQRDFFMENLPLVFPFVAGTLLAFASNPSFPSLGRLQFKGTVFVFMFLLPFYLMLGPWIGLALNLGLDQLWLVGGSGAIRLAPLFALVSGTGLAAAFIGR
jgi:hypothetical protein